MKSGNKTFALPGRWVRIESFVLRYGVAVTAILVAYWVREGLQRMIGGPLPPYVTFYPLVMLAALVGGAGPGLLATFATALLTQIWILPPVGRFYIASPSDRLGLLLFTVVCLCINAVVELYRRSRRKLAAYERETQFRLMFTNSLVGMVQADPGTKRFLRVNQAFCRFTGFAEAELLQRTIQEITHPDDQRLTTDKLEAFEHSAAPELDIEKRYVRRDGVTVWGRVNSNLIPASNGQPAYLFATIQDITERKQAEEALRESEQRFRTLADSIPNLAWWANGDGYILWYNRQWYEYTGTTPDQMQGWGWQSVHDPQVLPQVLERWQASIATGEPFDMEFPLRGADGRFRRFLTRVQPLKDAQGRVVRWFGTNTDVEERKRAEEAIQTSLREKEVMLKEIHHRVKNNLQVIASLVDLQAGGMKEPTLLVMFADIRDRVRSMALVHEKLYQSESLAQVDFADYARSLLSYLARSHGRPECAIELKIDLRSVSLSVEEAVPCGLIVNELVSNAYKHAFQGRASGEILATLGAGPDGRVSLRVADNGAGLPPGMDWRQSRSLGLRLIQLLAGQLHATVEVHTGSGTEFKISFEPETHKVTA